MKGPSVPLVLTGGLGALFLWCGITDRNPVEVLRAILSGKPLPGKGTGTPAPGVPGTELLNPNPSGTPGGSQAPNATVPNVPPGMPPYMDGLTYYGNTGGTSSA